MSGILRQPLHGCFEHGDIPGAARSRYDHRRKVPFVSGYGLNRRHDRSLFSVLRSLADLFGCVSCLDASLCPSFPSCHCVYVAYAILCCAGCVYDGSS